jgi:ribosome-binding protein aMBF1 (putative translation factor)
VLILQKVLHISYCVNMRTRRFTIRSIEDLATTISEARHERGFTQQALADLTGIERAYLSRLESGLSTVQVERTFQAFRALGIRLEATMDVADG